MLRSTFLVFALCLAAAPACAADRVTSDGRDFDGPAPFESIFDGESLRNWENPDMTYWTVEDGAITGRITREHPCTVNQYLVWKGGELADFELKLQSRLNGEGAINSGFQFRSRLLPDHDICGYQVDNNLQTPWLVRLYEEFGRHTLAMRGERTTFGLDGERIGGKLDPAEEPAWFRLEDWHDYHLICLGSKLTLFVNGKLAAEVVDQDPRRQAFKGILGLQLHSGPPSVVQFRDIRLKIIKLAEPVLQAPIASREKRRTALCNEAVAWWPLDSGGHGAHPPLRHIPGWEKFELNVRAEGQGARPGTRIVLLDGAYFDAGPTLPAEENQLTVFLRARDPKGLWCSALFSKGAGSERVTFCMSSGESPDTSLPDIHFEVGTKQGLVRVGFPVSKMEASAWHDIVGRYDGKSVALFCDGKLMASRRCHGALLKNDEPLLIGAEADGGKIVHHFHGQLQEAALWPRSLTRKEIEILSLPP